MPRTSAMECLGCPPLRALTTDVLGLVKVIEARGKVIATPKVVETWGPPDASRCVVAASFVDRQKDPLLAIARKNGLIEFLNPLNGDALANIQVNELGTSDHVSEDDPLIGLHLFRTRRLDSSSMLGVLLSCTEKGKVCLRSIATKDSAANFPTDSPQTWSISNSGRILCSSVDGNESYALFGGKGVEVNLWDLANCTKTWTAKSPPSNSLGIFTPTCFTAATFLNKDDHRKIVAGTNNHQIRLYDISAQRRPVISIDFRESPIKAVTEDLDGYTVYIGTGSGDLASFDMRTGKLLGCYVGKCCGSIRSIARHPELPVIASCGLDSYLRFWDAKTRQLLSAVFLKQNLTNVVIDSHFSGEESGVTDAKKPSQEAIAHDGEIVNELEHERIKSKNKRRNQDSAKKKKTKVKDDDQVSEVVEPEDSNELPASKKRKPAGDRSKKSKQKSKKQSLGKSGA
ncbi:ribosome biogenesis protein NSA1 isoform X1 [Typha latifolia]|uniref:ribosome biogenesis protein NSA1 isoform X1 n=1 Tax=Typha latifolia TaxID=4733 RepID=UPI003C2EF0AA